MQRIDAAWSVAFDDWADDLQAQGQLRRGSSIAVYRAMWQALATWCVAQRPPIAPQQLDARTLLAYIAARERLGSAPQALTPRYRWRLLSLVDRIEQHLSATQGRTAAGAARRLIVRDPVLRQANADGAQALPDHLAPDEARRLVSLLGATRRIDAVPTAKADWQRWRNRAAVALQLGAGLGPGELRALRLSHVTRLGSLSGRWLRVPASAGTPAHETPVAPWATQLLRSWLAIRATLGFPGDWVFPSTRSGKPWGKVAQYEAAQAVLAEAGIANEREGGSFRLRHTFALRQLRRGHAAHQVALWLGVGDPAVMARYERALAAQSVDPA